MILYVLQNVECISHIAVLVTQVSQSRNMYDEVILTLSYHSFEVEVDVDIPKGKR